MDNLESIIFCETLFQTYSISVQLSNLKEDLEYLTFLIFNNFTLNFPEISVAFVFFEFLTSIFFVAGIALNNHIFALVSEMLTQGEVAHANQWGQCFVFFGRLTF